MHKNITIVFSAYQSEFILKKILKKISSKYKIIIIENSLDKKIKIISAAVVLILIYLIIT